MTIKHYVVQTKPCHEAIAHGNLTAAGFEAYLPTIRMEVRTRFGRDSVLSPMFPGYLFVRFDIARDPWRGISSLRGVRDGALMGPVDRPTAVPDAVMAIVRAMEASKNAEQTGAGADVSVSAGDHVLIERGSLEGFFGLCTKSKGERVWVLVKFMGAAREIEMAAESMSRRTA